jgi:hypothetical protein
MNEVYYSNSGYAVGWFTLALINAGLAQGKGRSGLIWFFISVFTGPLATLALVTFFSNVKSSRRS